MEPANQSEELQSQEPRQQPQMQPQQQQQQPVAPQSTKAPVPQPASSLVPNLHAHDRPLRLWRLGIRVAATVAVALSMILLIAQGATEDYDSSCGYSYYSGRYCRDYGTEGYDFVSLPILVAAMIWNIAEFITYCANKRGAHPGVHVGLDLLAWLCLLFAGIFSIARSVIGDNSVGVAGGAMEAIACLLHFILFVMACVATHRRRMLMRNHLVDLQARLANPQVVYSYPPPPPGMSYMATGHYGPQYHELQEHRAMPAQPNTSAPSAVSPISSTVSAQPAAPYNSGDRYA